MSWIMVEAGMVRRWREAARVKGRRRVVVRVGRCIFGGVVGGGGFGLVMEGVGWVGGRA